ncbi:unnamed protein product [Dicrocoelium dendriticum]|nr:unnamed protein product [Dicrocoelium dendriticum]
MSTLVVLLLLYFAHTLGIPDEPSCSCPFLIAGKEDCCCDKTSAGYNEKTFKFCLNQAKRQLNAVCINPALYFGVNVNFETFYDENGHKCYTAFSYSALNFVNAPVLAVSLRDTSELKSAYQSSYQTTGFTNVLTDAILSKERIAIQFDNGIQGVFSLPGASSDGGCNVAYFPKFMHNTTHSCRRFLTVTDGGKSCSHIPGLQRYSSGFKFRQRTEPMIEPKKFSLFIPISPVTCVDEFGTSVSCPKGNTTYDKKHQVCGNVIVRVTYTFAFNVTGLQKVMVEAVVKDNLTHSFDQTFVIQFTETRNDSNPNLLRPQESDYLSGAPGYRARYPIRAGVLTKSGSIKMTSVKISLPLDQREAAGRMHGWWAVPAGGECKPPLNATTDISTVRFGVNFRSSCILEYTSSISDQGNLSACVALEEQILSALNADTVAPTHVSRWGNSPESNVSDWLPITISQINRPGYSNEKVTATERSCNNIIIGQIIRIVYARTGQLTNLQNQILAVQRRFYRGIIAFKCGGRYCMKSNSKLTQTKSVNTEVRFVDATITPVIKRQSRPISETWDPGSFLYLFQANSRASEQ